MREFKVIIIYLWILLFSSLLVSCSFQEKNVAEEKAIVILVGNLQGMIFQEQGVIIAFKDRQDSVHIESVTLPNFERPAFPGDSLEVFVYPNEIKFGKLYKYAYSIKERYVYVMSRNSTTRKALFDNGVLTIGTFDSTGKVSSLEFFTYEAESDNSIKAYPIGFPNYVAFSIDGHLGEDSLSLEGQGDVYYDQPISK